MTNAAPKKIVGRAEAARMVGVSLSALQMAEQRGSIPPAERDEGCDDRVYSESDIERLRLYFAR